MADPKEPVDDEPLDDELSPEDELEDEPPPEGDEPPADEDPPADPPKDDEPPADDEAEPTTVRAPSRGQRQFGELRTENRELKRRLEALERRPAAADPHAIEQQQRREREEEEAVLLSADSGRIAKFYSDRSERKLDQRLNQIAFHAADSADRTAFQAELAKHPELAAVEDEVEERLAQARAGGINPQRFALAKIAFADRILARTKSAKTRQGKRAAATNARQAAKPGNGRSDVTAARRPSGDNQSKRAQRLDESGML